MLFKKKVLSSSVALALVGSAMPALAQDDGLEIEEVIVEGGIRASLKRSMDIKRDSVGVADAISAEDMGKFPDTNLAESLQRVTGVSISRQRGEGSQITVRGFGPEYNLVTLNGRQMPTHNGENRSFDFGDLASEGISSVVIHKTGNATAPTGGVGSLVNIITTKPLEAGSIATFGAKAVHDTSTALGDDYTSEFSGLYSETFADDTIGVALSASAQSRNNAVNVAGIGGWWTLPGDTDSLAQSVPVDANQINRPTTANENLSVPQSQSYRLSEYSTDRINGQLTLQWAPSETVTATLDYTYSEFDLEQSYSDLSAWYGLGNQAPNQSSSWDEGPISSAFYYKEKNDHADFAMGTGNDGSANENKSLGFNLDWMVSDNLTLNLDYHDSSADRGATSPYGNSSLVTMASYNRMGTHGYFDKDLPVLELDLGSEPDGSPRPLYKNDMIITGSVFGNSLASMNLEQTKLSGTYDFSDVTSVDFGVTLTEMDNRNASASVDRGTWGGISEPGYISDILVRSSMADSFDQISGSEDPRRQTEYFTTTLDQLVELAEKLPVGASEEVGDCGTPYCALSDWENESRLGEETLSAYFQLSHATEFDGMPMDLTLGLRYEETDVNSQTLETVFTGVYSEAGEEYYLVKSDAKGFSSYDDGYNLFLPNLDIKLEISEDIVARASVSKTATRAPFTDLNGGVSVGGDNFKFGNARASGGNPGLVPMESENFDLSFEWYYGDSDYLSIGYFHKEVENFISNGFDTRNLFGLTDPASGGEYLATAQAEGLNPQGSPIPILKAMKDAGLFDADGRYYGTAANDPLLFTVSSPVNEKTAKVDGMEINLQHNIGDTGFGFIVNATVVDANVAFDPNLLKENQFALCGLSDSANFIGFYDKDGINVRIAYNWRDDFLGGVGAGQGSQSITPQYTEAYAQWDMSASYEISDNLTVFMDGINITDETYRVHGREEMQVMQAGQTGPRYNLGVRYTF